MKIKFKYLIPIMLLACLNIAVLNDFFEINLFYNNEIADQFFTDQQLAKANKSNSADSGIYIIDSIKTKELKVY